MLLFYFRAFIFILVQKFAFQKTDSSVIFDLCDFWPHNLIDPALGVIH